MFLGFLQLKHHGIGGILAPDDATIHSVMNSLNHLGRFGLLRYRRIVLLWRRLKNNHRDYQICRKTEKNDGADLIRNIEHLGCDDPLEHRGQLALENMMTEIQYIQMVGLMKLIRKPWKKMERRRGSPPLLLNLIRGSFPS